MKKETEVRRQESEVRRPGSESFRSLDTGHWLLVFFLLLFLSCGEGAENGEDYGDLLESPEALTLTEDEHEIGWGHSECSMCHNLENIHLVNNTSLPIDIEAVHDQALEEGDAVCQDCHGTNGVP